MHTICNILIIFRISLQFTTSYSVFRSHNYCNHSFLSPINNLMTTPLQVSSAPYSYLNKPNMMMLPAPTSSQQQERGPSSRKKKQHKQLERGKRSLTPPRTPLRQYYDHETSDKMTALHLFCRSGSRHGDIKTVVKLQPQLISHQTPKGGDTLLHFAVAAHDLDTTRLLLEKQPDAASVKSSQSGNFGSEVTPLHVAILASASLEIIEALVRASPRSVKVRDGNGQTAHALAVKYYAWDHLEEVCTRLQMYM
jgi:hypothetical protein